MDTRVCADTHEWQVQDSGGKRAAIKHDKREKMNGVCKQLSARLSPDCFCSSGAAAAAAAASIVPATCKKRIASAPGSA